MPSTSRSSIPVLAAITAALLATGAAPVLAAEGLRPVPPGFVDPTACERRCDQNLPDPEKYGLCMSGCRKQLPVPGAAGLDAGLLEAYARLKGLWVPVGETCEPPGAHLFVLDGAGMQFWDGVCFIRAIAAEGLGFRLTLRCSEGASITDGETRLLPVGNETLFVAGSRYDRCPD